MNGAIHLRPLCLHCVGRNQLNFSICLNDLHETHAAMNILQLRSLHRLPCKCQDVANLFDYLRFASGRTICFTAKKILRRSG